MTDPALSLVIPMFNERESLAALCAEIGAVARDQNLAIEIIFIDDGSTDGSWDLVKELAAHDPRIRGLKFRRNFGKAAALQAGFREARGAQALTLDADLQDDPAEIPNFLKQLDSGFDLVSGWKKVRHDPWHKVLPSRVFNGMVSWLTGVNLHDHNCGMKAYDTAIFKEVRLYGEFHRFVPVLAAAKGFRVGELVIQHRARKFGRSKYGFRRFLRGFLDLVTVKYLTTYGRRPMHLFGHTTLLMIMAAVVLAVIGIFWSPLFSPLTMLAIVLGVLGSLMVFLNGLQAETLAALRTDEPYSIVERIG
ncbi:MAG TPA: glycosyltransferase family 2 protein [Gemmataceae bacterium]|jgi:dolichol-phosphate mannosyltransferase|nr:glycosyltransferase family 2 protein [Gemmataceae bacterium]